MDSKLTPPTPRPYSRFPISSQPPCFVSADHALRSAPRAYCEASRAFEARSTSSSQREAQESPLGTDALVMADLKPQTPQNIRPATNGLSAAQTTMRAPCRVLVGIGDEKSRVNLLRDSPVSRILLLHALPCETACATRESAKQAACATWRDCMRHLAGLQALPGIRLEA